MNAPRAGVRAAIAGAALLLAPMAGLAAPLAPAPASASSDPVSSAELREWIAQMKTSPKGPFDTVRWFCSDGSVLPPVPYACSELGGGVQHGVLNARARELRQRGFSVANVLASLDPARFVGDAADLDALRQIVLERFLMRWDDGWIFRGARSYRGALQVEDEEASTQALVLALLGDPRWLEPARFLLLREIARSLPLPDQRDLAARVRELAAEIGDADPGFAPLRARIHSTPDASDASRVRAYARHKTSAERYEELARTIDELYQARATALLVAPLARRVGGTLGATLGAELPALASKLPEERLAAAARGLEAIRLALAQVPRPAARLAALRASLTLENEAFASGRSSLAVQRSGTRREQLALLDPLATSLYGTGLIGARHLTALRGVLDRLAVGSEIPLGVWRSELGYLARAPEWSRRWLAFHFGPAIEKLAEVESQVLIYEADRLRSSALLSYTALLDTLAIDAQRLSGTADRVLGEAVGTGLRALNPGIARGILRRAVSPEEVAALAPDSVALLPETIALLPPVAAIITLGEGSSLSHVQLLARNLGIPNAVVSNALADRLAGQLGTPVEMAVSPGGVVQIDAIGADDLPRAQAEPAADLEIRVDEQRLDLATTSLVPLNAVGAEDSGRLCGPKAANLGELRRHFGAAVPDGFVIPFGVFRRLLDRPIETGGPSAFEWLAGAYAEARSLPPSERATANAVLLARMREWIGAQDPGAEFRSELAQQLAALGEGGVFVRSDTNVEDLPGFTGAGLNLTVANVVGADRVIEAVLRVWASPFSDRAHAWRQAHMQRPELVFPSVLVQRAFPAEKSGVMITLDVDTGDPGRLSVALGEGVGGAVDGQASESLRIDRATGAMRFLAQATAPLAAELDSQGGIRRRPASGAESLLQPAEAAALIDLAERVAGFPALRAADGSRMAADVEFAFRSGELALLQIRPFVESRRARESERLRALDAPSLASAERAVALDAQPGSEAALADADAATSEAQERANEAVIRELVERAREIVGEAP